MTWHHEDSPYSQQDGVMGRVHVHGFERVRLKQQARERRINLACKAVVVLSAIVCCVAAGVCS